MTPADLPAVSRIAVAVHPRHPEGDAVFAERLALWPRGCLVLGAGIRGYALSHPWGLHPPPLDTLLGALPARPEVYYIHDVALMPEARGGGAGSAAVARLAAVADAMGLPLALVAVPGSAPFWARQGFAITGPAGGSYGEGSVAMRRPASTRRE
ncbi:GNAT family N-acetyltransferase [Salinarimonas soli]|uniref:GNAT family N-acetyltransferase n=2 Tax=Salinarimonas soli TaxID=1638099 RepID=A0A5B2VDK4_9HYPH|nr:GNAT family N-acetyltransferase [Salinarimonas soli]